MNKIRLGIIGCGRAAEFIYMPLLKRNTKLIVTAVVDPLKERREYLASVFNNCRAADSIDEGVINLIDAAIISTPPDTHVQAAQKLLGCGKDVLVEKPLSNNMRGINELKDTLSLSQANLLMAFNHRYWSPVSNLKTIIHKNGVLHSRSAEITFSGNYAGWNPVSFHSDSLEDLGPHVFDLIRYIFEQEITSLRTEQLKPNEYNISIKTSDGINITSRIAHSDITEKKLSVFAEDKIYFIRLGSVRCLPMPGLKRKILDLKDTIVRKLLHQKSPIKHSYEIQLNKFVNMIGNGKMDKPDVSDGIAALKAVTAARLSFTRKEEVLLDEIK